MSIDWTKPELYWHATTGADIARVHVIPDWCREDYPVIIEWSDGLFDCYMMDGRCTKASALPHVIPKPRKPRVVELWVNESAFNKESPSHVLYLSDPRDISYVKVRVEEVIDETA